MHLDVDLGPRARRWRVSFFSGFLVAIPLAAMLWAALIVTAIWLSS